ncbi:hypothetical protein K9L16_03260 [Candidatus Pacearchaeota archaeon]|nr:hypothetical protein [Candidatus Pacearchaeota archaeon]
MSKRGQVWIEAVMYTLISIIVLTLVLAYAKPKIDEMKDKAILEQTIGIINEIDQIVLSIVQGGTGNRRVVNVGLKKGTLMIDGENDEIFFEMESAYKFTEPGKEVMVGDITALTQTQSGLNFITLKRTYNYNLTYEEQEESKSVTPSSTPYKIYITHKGKVSDKINLDFQIK